MVYDNGVHSWTWIPTFDHVLVPNTESTTFGHSIFHILFYSYSHLYWYSSTDFVVDAIQAKCELTSPLSALRFAQSSLRKNRE